MSEEGINYVLITPLERYAYCELLQRLRYLITHDPRLAEDERWMREVNNIDELLGETETPGG
jgi:hypothetical protein